MSRVDHAGGGFGVSRLGNEVVSGKAKLIETKETTKRQLQSKAKPDCFRKYRPLPRRRRLFFKQLIYKGLSRIEFLPKLDL